MIPGDTSTFKLITGTCALTMEHSVFSIMPGLLKEMLFMLFSIYIYINKEMNNTCLCSQSTVTQGGNSWNIRRASLKFVHAQCCACTTKCGSDDFSISSRMPSTKYCCGIIEPCVYVGRYIFDERLPLERGAGFHL